MKNVNSRLDNGLVDAIKAANEMGLPFDLDNNLKGARDYMSSTVALSIEAGNQLQGITKEIIDVPYADNSHSIRLFIYKPENTTNELPAIYWTHGGGLVVGQAEQDEGLLKNLVKELNCIAISVEYRLAPEFPFPTPLEDIYLGLKWVYANAKDIHVDAKRIAISGASAGGGLSACLAQISRDRNELPHPIIFQLLLYPMLDCKNVHPLHENEEDTYFWSKANNAFGWQSYIGSDPLTTNIPKYASASHIDNFEKLPPAMLLVGGVDLFVTENIEYAKCLNMAGVATEFHLFPGGVHGFETMAPDARITKLFNEALLGRLKELFSK
jgi:acetyl esterase/lipase